MLQGMREWNPWMNLSACSTFTILPLSWCLHRLPNWKILDELVHFIMLYVWGKNDIRISRLILKLSNLSYARNLRTWLSLPAHQKIYIVLQMCRIEHSGSALNRNFNVPRLNMHNKISSMCTHQFVYSGYSWLYSFTHPATIYQYNTQLALHYFKDVLDYRDIFRLCRSAMISTLMIIFIYNFLWHVIQYTPTSKAA